MLDREQLRQEVHFKALRSRGPGGQNVNKVSSAAVLYWDFMLSPLLSDEQKTRLRSRLHGMINAEMQLYVRSDEFRDLERNKDRCVQKLTALIQQALHVPKKRKATKPTYSSKVKRRDNKTRRGETKKLRRRVDY